jgi:hypothetical protein
MWNIWEFDHDGEFGLDLKDIMVMWAMWLCIQTFSCVATPLWAKCEDETHTPKSGNLESSKT